MYLIKWLIWRKIFNSLFPRALFSLSPKKFSQRNHWSKQNKGDSHGYEQYSKERPQAAFLFSEIKNLVSRDSKIMDVGCNCGWYLMRLSQEGYSRLCGVDISRNAVEYGIKEFNLQNAELHVGSFEEVLPKLILEGCKYDLIYSMGATIELVHPSFDIIKSLCQLSSKYIILFIQEWGHSAPRLYEYEFQKHNFLMVKCMRPYDGTFVNTRDLSSFASMLIFQKIS